jgi:hypothetical protein
VPLVKLESLKDFCKHWRMLESLAMPNITAGQEGAQCTWRKLADLSTRTWTHGHGHGHMDTDMDTDTDNYVVRMACEKFIKVRALYIHIYTAYIHIYTAYIHIYVYICVCVYIYKCRG